MSATWSPDAHEVLQASSASDLAGVANDMADGSAIGVATVGAARCLTRSAHQPLFMKCHQMDACLESEGEKRQESGRGQDIDDSLLHTPSSSKIALSRATTCNGVRVQISNGSSTSGTGRKATRILDGAWWFEASTGPTQRRGDLTAAQALRRCRRCRRM